MHICSKTFFAGRALGAGEDLKGFDVDNKWGKKALDRIYSDILGSTDQMPGVQVATTKAATFKCGRTILQRDI